MYVEDIKSDFYEFLGGKHIFLMVHYDIDSICACKILQSLFQYKHTIYSLAVIRGIHDIKTAYEENASEVKYFVLVNCGGTVDIVDLLEPDDDVVFFILDARRPTDLCNIYSNGQVKLLWEADDDHNVPDFHDVFREDSDEEDNDSANGDSEGENENDNEGDGERPASKRRRLGEEAILKRRERRLWEDNRNKLLFEYLQFTYYSKASAILAFELATRLNIDDKPLLWLAIVALTEQLICGKIERTHYVLCAGSLQAHCQRLHNRAQAESGGGNASSASNATTTNASTGLQITFEKDLDLLLYRHWTVDAAFRHSQLTACKLRLWSLRGEKKMQELLLEMGLPLAQSKQSFKTMDLQLRKEFQSSVEKLSDKYGLSDIVYVTFVLQFGYRHRYNASDVVYALLSILESTPRTKPPEECFNTALDCLSRAHADTLQNCIEKAKDIAKCVFKTVQSALEMKSITFAGPYVYYIIKEGCLEWAIFSQPHILTLLAKFLLQAFVATSRNKKAANLPLIVSAPFSEDLDTCIILGIPPYCENSPKNFFGKAFEQAAERIGCDGSCDYFDTSCKSTVKYITHLCLMH